MNLRAPDRRDPRSKVAGGIGTLVVHAGAALFLAPALDHIVQHFTAAER